MEPIPQSPSTTAPFGEPGPDDDRVVAALEEYVKAQEAGERVDRDAFVARFPDIAEVLAAYLDGLDFVRGAGRQLGSSAGNGSAFAPGPTTAMPLGDFRLVRELGRGGMGVVYEAEQLSLGRRVALKVLPLAATLDPRRLQRFKNEVQAAAALHHTNIVPVYFVGCERGVHYYAMQLIQGQTLAEVIQQEKGDSVLFRPASSHNDVSAAAEKVRCPLFPTRAALTTERSDTLAFCRAVARLGVQAAAALEHAHQLGVVHRDIKPSNLMLDARGDLWVADFGLARLPGDPGLTMSGDVVGTLRYMSPEQALGKRPLIDHRTDIYSLGATLYELLTLEPVFAGKDREELLRQFTFEEPVPPRRLNKAVPTDLEAIVLKALEKSPSDRYASAQELADDLERHLKDEPIRARRPGMRVRLTKWARRHRPLVAGLASAAAILVIALVAGALWYAAQASELASQRLQVNGQIGDALTEAKTLLTQAQAAGREQPVLWARAREAAGRAQTLADSSLADPAQVQRVRELHQKLDEDEQDRRMIGWLEEARIPPLNPTGTDYDRRWIEDHYRSAFQKYGIDVQKMIIEATSDRIKQRAVHSSLVAALDDWAAHARDPEERDHLIGIARAADLDARRDQIRAAYLNKDRPALKALVATVDVETVPAPTLLLLEEALRSVGEAKAAADLLRRAQPVHAGDFWVNHRLGMCLLAQQPRVPADAIPFLTAAAALRPDSAVARNNLASVLAEAGQLDAAQAQYREALRQRPDYASAHANLGNIYKARSLLGDAVREYREAIRLDRELPGPHCNLGDVLGMQGKTDEAVAELREALRLLPDFPEAHLNLGAALAGKGLLDEAIVEFEEVIRLNRTYVAEAHRSLGDVLKRKGQQAAADGHYAEAHARRGEDLYQRKDLRGALAEFRAAARLRPEDAVVFMKIGFVLADQGQVREAAAALRQAIDLNPERADFHFSLGQVLFKARDYDGAIAAFRAAIRLAPDFAEAHNSLGFALSAVNRWDEAIAEYQVALRPGKDTALIHFRLATAYRAKGDFHAALAAVRRGHEAGANDPYWRDVSAAWVRSDERLVELDDKLPAILTNQIKPASPAERIELAELCTLKQMPAAAARFYEEAFAAEPGLRGANRYKAASAAALAGCGKGNDAPKTDAARRESLRAEALRWLRDELTKLTQENLPPTALEQQLGRWQRDPALAGVRDPAALTRLPVGEQDDWRQLWADVRAVLQPSPKVRPTPQRPGDVE